MSFNNDATISKSQMTECDKAECDCQCMEIVRVPGETLEINNLLCFDSLLKIQRYNYDFHLPFQLLLDKPGRRRTHSA